MAQTIVTGQSMMLTLYDHQISAVKRLKNGSILCGGVGTGKSRTSLAYYYICECGGSLPFNGNGSWKPMASPRDLYIITTAKKRDTNEWFDECAAFCITDDSEINESHIKVTVDSWNNIKKYAGVSGAFFIFDEQRVVGYGAWTKAFLRIASKNHWILLSATPGDTWSDYIPVFIANGFYRNKTDFVRQHAIYSRFTKYPKIERYVGVGKLIKLRNYILVDMEFDRPTVSHHEYIQCKFDRELYKRVAVDRWNVYDNEPIQETGKLCYLMRQVPNSDKSRIEAVSKLFGIHDRIIVFYNFDYERKMLEQYLEDSGIEFKEWNGKRHEQVPTSKRWAYLVQYTAGAEGWNCITTDTIIFYSQNYSYRVMTQAAGRIDRMNTPYLNLFYYHLISSAPIDLAIRRAVSKKKNFNESAFIGKLSSHAKQSL